PRGDGFCLPERASKPEATERNMTWTDERVERLRKLWADGLTASQIASALGGVSRNAVIGKVHRLGLPGRAKPAPAAQPRPRKPSRPHTHSAPAPSPRPMIAGNTALKAEPVAAAPPEPEPPPLEVVPIGERATILTLNEHTCKWPVGDPGSPDFFFCGARSE